MRSFLFLWCLSIFFVACEPSGRWRESKEEESGLQGAYRDVSTGDILDAGSSEPIDVVTLDSNIVDADKADVVNIADATNVNPDVQLDAGTADAQSTRECGNGIVEPGEVCDDGVTNDCLTTHEGGDGVCVAAGTCSEGYIISEEDCVLAEERFIIDIFVSNFCEMSTSPEEFFVPTGQTAYFTWRNRSVDYPIDVWKSYGGGFLDLPTGQNWEEGFAHCAGPNPSEQFADIDAGGCASFRFLIHCL